jgi:hypothetical protein
MKGKKTLYESFKQYKVEAKSVEEFCLEYYKHKKLHNRGESYIRIIIESKIKELKENGFTFISHHDSKTGEIVSFYCNK